ncbi:unnamed protein product [Dracunculus medinensis]|uniref:Secreted protein n=1 Tax=Dracunculus medinensis TaxID=318479 RepID=A0A0N4U0K0_DRAME|nr:unnamed protein product [Dracunculus medinensis]
MIGHLLAAVIASDLPSIASPILNPADFPRFLFTIGEKKTPSLSCYSEDDDDDDKWLVAVPTKWMSIKRD